MNIFILTPHFQVCSELGIGVNFKTVKPEIKFSGSWSLFLRRQWNMGHNVDNGFLKRLNDTLFKDGWLKNSWSHNELHEGSA